VGLGFSVKAGDIVVMLRLFKPFILFSIDRLHVKRLRGVISSIPAEYFTKITAVILKSSTES
jgi:hypothetical protein